MAESTADKELDAGQDAVRAEINAAGYGNWVSDEQCRMVAYKVLTAAAAVRKAHERT